MSTGTIKASTQDNSAGTPVATAVNEDGTGSAIQVFVAVSSVSTWNALTRSNISAADSPTGGDMTASSTGFAGTSAANLLDKGNAINVHTWCNCTTSNASMSGQIAFYDTNNNFLTFGPVMNFTSDGTLRLGNSTGNFVAAETSYSDVTDCRSARKVAFFVRSISTGNWTINLRPI